MPEIDRLTPQQKALLTKLEDIIEAQMPSSKEEVANLTELKAYYYDLNTYFIQQNT